MSYLYKLRDLKDIIRVRNPQDILRSSHYAVIVYEKESVYIEGDERSRTAPGHGYPAHTEHYDTFKHYITSYKEQWITLIKFLMEDDDTKDNFLAFEVSKVADVKLKVVVE